MVSNGIEMQPELMKSAVVRVMGEEEPIHISFDSVVAYHGQAALAMLAITFQGLRATLSKLSPSRAPERSAISVVSGHPGPGVRDAFEFVTRAVTRKAYTVDRSLRDALLNPKADISYSFRITLNDQSVSAALRPGVLPARFFELNSIGPERSAAEESEFSALKRQIASEALKAPPERLFTLR
jgi:hypothetical protein